ncbi:hypothetical protein H5410_047211 [Solanum commersonii]|uniref:Uncharacterized protein n=1 Tax=Solanum commersonii TaxID=4109 RepID=A0A9J5XEF5_SOLCO|nr:hypothetical protein H5410_047211 [Solanum commersonii]
MEPDRLRWRHSSEGSFTVNKLYKRENSIMQEEELKIWRSVWKNIAPTKVSFFNSALIGQKSPELDEFFLLKPIGI